MGKPLHSNWFERFPIMSLEVFLSHPLKFTEKVNCDNFTPFKADFLPHFLRTCLISKEKNQGVKSA